MAALRALRTLRDRRHGRLPLYEEITPSASWTDGVNGSNLIIDIPGFKNEEVNMEIDEFGNVSIKGRHDVGNNRFRRFSMTVKAPEKTDMKRVVGSIEGGLYTVVFPKMDDDDKTDKEAALDTEPLSSTEKAVTEAESLTEAAVDKTDEKVPVPATANEKTEAVSVMETMLKKIMDTNIPEVKNATKTEDEIVTKEPETATKLQQTSDDQERQTASKSPETSADQEPQTISKPTETSAKAAETVTRPPETSAKAAAMESENPTTKMGSASALPEPNRASTVKNKMVKFVTKNEEQEHQEIKVGGFLDNVMEMITEHKACIVSVILAFSLGILISRRSSS